MSTYFIELIMFILLFFARALSFCRNWALCSRHPAKPGASIGKLGAAGGGSCPQRLNLVT